MSLTAAPAHPPAPGAARPAAVRWVGHATVLIELGGMRVLTDPVFAGRLGHLRRHRPACPTAARDVDVVVISHLHLDHLHLPSLRQVGRHVPLVVPRGAAGLLARRGFEQVTEVVSGDRVRFGALTVEVVDAAHSHRRGPHSRLSAPALGYVLRAGGDSVYFAGDTDLFSGMKDLAGVDVALLPIWGWGADLGEGHLDPERAGVAAEWVAPGIVVPIHWGTYSPLSLRRGAPDWLDLPARRFREVLTAGDHGDRLRLVPPGGRVPLPRRDPSPAPTLP